MEEDKMLFKEDGKYYMQGQLAYQEPEEMVYDDSFKTSISELFRKHKPRTMPQMQALLNENGYVGRNKVRRLYKDACYPLNDYVIEVELIWGQTKYSWPYGGFYSLDFNRIERDKKRVLPGNIVPALEIMYQYSAAGPHFIVRKLGVSLEEGEAIVAALEEMGLIRDGDLKIVDDLELKEVIGNLLK